MMQKKEEKNDSKGGIAVCVCVCVSACVCVCVCACVLVNLQTRERERESRKCIIQWEVKESNLETGNKPCLE
jgi:hypothetical protein